MKVLKQPWLLIDTPNLAWRAFHSTGGLTWEGQDTGVVYGVLKTIQDLRARFRTDRLAFCFDAGFGLRKQVNKEYKAKRIPATPEEAEARRRVHVEIERLRDEHLPVLGFCNVFWQDGYEADDVIAALVKKSVPSGEACVIVSTDKDLYQLLAESSKESPVRIWNPVKAREYTRKDFKAEWGCSPLLWPKAKALAGCDGDGVTGIEGVGEKTAIKYLTGRLRVGTDTWKRIREQEQAMMERNLLLVRLPYRGIREFELVGEEFDPGLWKKLCVKLGMKSLIDPFDRIQKRGGEVRLVIAGSRTVNSYAMVRRAVNWALVKWGIKKVDRVICGMADGADKLGKRWADRRGIPVDERPAEWSKHGKAAGPIRNGVMADLGTHAVVIIKNESRGSLNMIQQMKKRGKSVLVYRAEDM